MWPTNSTPMSGCSTVASARVRRLHRLGIIIHHCNINIGPINRY
jgi:hypothetical protein